MKKWFFLLCLFSSSCMHAQTSKWFMTVAQGAAVGGPSASIKKNMDRCGFNSLTTYSFFGWSGSTQYPKVEKGLPLLVTIGKKIKDYKSAYLTGGIANRGRVSGFRSFGSFDALLVSGSTGISMDVDYQVWQFTAGYQFTFPKSKAKLGIGPSIALLRYHEMQENQRYNAMVPAFSGMARLPLGRERRLFGVEVFFETLLAPPVQIEAFSKTYSADGHNTTLSLKKEKASMIQAVAGISFAFREHRKTK